MAHDPQLDFRGHSIPQFTDHFDVSHPAIK